MPHFRSCRDARKFHTTPAACNVAMASEAAPSPTTAALRKPLAWLTGQALRFPRAVLAAAGILALLAAGFAAAGLQFKTRRHDLISPNTPYNQRWLKFLEEFGEGDDAVFVVEGSGPESIVPVLDELAEHLTQQPRHFRAVLHEIDLTPIRAKGLHYLSLEELDELEQFVAELEPVFRGQWSGLKLSNVAAQVLRRRGPSSGAATAVAAPSAENGDILYGLAASLSAALQEDGAYQSPWGELPALVANFRDTEKHYLLTNEGRVGFVLVHLVDDGNRFVRHDDAIRAARAIARRVAAHHPQVKIGLTGLPVMEHDEMQASQRAMSEATLLSLAGVALLFLAGLGGMLHPLLAVGALLIGMLWSVGYIALGIGHLNILSMSFSVILIGLGVDFGIHYVARYLAVRRMQPDVAAALEQTSAEIGPGIVTGALTTAIAFFAAALTQFQGIVELGLIAGGGILLCCVAALWALPPLIMLADRRRPHRPAPEPLPVDRWLHRAWTRRGATLAMALGLTAAAALGLPRLWYDHNLLNLQPEGLESVELEERLLAQSNQSLWYALSIADSPEELMRRKAAFAALPCVERTEEIVSFLPALQPGKRQRIEQIARRLEHLPEEVPLIPLDQPETLSRSLAELHRAAARHDPRGAALLAELQKRLEQLPAATCYQRLSWFQQQLADDLLRRLQLVQSMAASEPPQLDDLPPSLVTRFVGQSGRYLLKVYGRGSIWNMDDLSAFVRAVRRVDPDATGNPLQAYEASRDMQRSYQLSALYALVGIVLVLYLDLGSIRMTALTLVPVGFGLVQLLGLMGLLNLPLNPANMLVLPLILGIGVDNGVHIVHDYLSRPSGPYRMSPATAAAVLLTSLTTMLGFGTLMMADHRGLESLGRTLTLGMTCCLFSSLLVLPPLLMIVRRWQEGGDVPDVSEEEPADEHPAPVRTVPWRVVAACSEAADLVEPSRRLAG